MRASLVQVVEEKIEALEDSLRRIDSLLNRWDSNSTIEARWDLLQRRAAWLMPDGHGADPLDSLRAVVGPVRGTLDSLAAMERRHAVVRDSLALMRTEMGLADEPLPLWLFYGYLLLNFVLALALYLPLPKTLRRFKDGPYSNEYLLHERTEEVLERLRYQLTVAEGEEASANLGPFRGLSLSRRRSRRTTRASRPFTVLSLVEEYKQYIQNVQFHLKEALKIDKEEEKVKIVVAIDELDKVLDTERLHAMLKSIKAVFDIKDVYYLLSISEDALGTYRLRHLENKNEIDSAFTHIFSMPPMNAEASLRFNQERRSEREWPEALLPAAIVFGGGVPRDMHRMAQLLLLGPWKDPEKEHDPKKELDPEKELDACLNYLYDEDLRAAQDLIKQNPMISDTWRQQFIDELRKKPTSPEEVKTWTFDKFEPENPCSGDAARQVFYQMRSLLNSMAIKGFLYGWLRQNFISNPTLQEVKNRLRELEHLRETIFDLSANPLGAWEALQKGLKIIDQDAEGPE